MLKNKPLNQGVADYFQQQYDERQDWFRVTYLPVFFFDVDEWLDENCEGRYQTSISIIYFEKESDAIIFMLKGSHFR